jgi:hypothetical protein
MRKTWFSCNLGYGDPSRLFPRVTVAPALSPVRLEAGHGSDRASCVTTTGQSDVANTDCVVDVHCRGGPITRTSACDVCETLTTSVAGTPCFTTSSISHQARASGGTAADRWSRTSAGEGSGSVITQTTMRCPCVSQASERACLMTLTEVGARSTAHRTRLKRPGLARSTCSPPGTIRTGQSARATTVAVTEPIGRPGRSSRQPP